MVLPVAQQGEDHTPHAFHGEFPDPTDSLCKERDGHKRATSCPASHRCRPCAHLPQCHHPTLAFQSHNSACVWQPGKLRQQWHDQWRGQNAGLNRILCITSPWTGPGCQGEVQTLQDAAPSPLKSYRIPELKIETR